MGKLWNIDFNHQKQNEVSIEAFENKIKWTNKKYWGPLWVNNYKTIPTPLRTGLKGFNFKFSSKIIILKRRTLVIELIKEENLPSW